MQRSPLQRERDLARTEEMYLRGRTHLEIADALNISKSTVKKDLRNIIQRYSRNVQRNFESDVQRQLRRIDMLERQAWADYDASREDRKITQRRTRRKAGGDGEINTSEVGDRVEQRDPDTRYLVVIQWCIAERSKLMGLYPPEDLRVTGTLGKVQEIVYELPPREQPAPGLTIIGGDQALPPPAVVPAERPSLDELWGSGDDEIVVERVEAGAR